MSNGRATLLTNANVLTMEEGATPQQAIVLKDGRVQAAGSASDMQALAGSDAVRLDMDGRTVMPGLVDTHPHLIHWAGFMDAVVDLFDAKSHDDIVARIRKAAETTPEGQWIACSPIGEPHYFQRRSWRDLAEGRLPDRHVLDAAAPNHPVWIQAWAPVNPNTTVFNTLGLRSIQISRNSPDVIGRVAVEKDADGEPTGRLSGPVNNYYNNEPWWDSVLARIYVLEPENFIRGAIDGMADANRRGVTSIFEGHIMDWPLIDVYRAHRESGALTTRVLCTPDGEPHGLATSVELTMEQLQARLEHAYSIQDLSDDLLRVESFLCTRGGPMGPGMMIWHRQYRDAYGQWTNGLEFLPPEKGKAMVDFAASRGMRMNLISVADREHDIALGHLESARKQWDFTELGWILQHAYFMSDEHCKRYLDLGFNVTTSMSFSWGKQHIFEERIGRDVLEDLIPIRRELDHGLKVGCGSDWGPANRWEHIRFATTHEGVHGAHNAGPAQVVSREEAVTLWTRWAGEVLRWKGIGTLAAGSYADLIAVDRDPIACDVDDLPDTQVDLTLLGGKPVHNGGAISDGEASALADA